MLLTQNICVIETAEITREGHRTDANTTRQIVEKLKDEKSNLLNVSAVPVANNDTLVFFYWGMSYQSLKNVCSFSKFFSHHHPSHDELDPALPGKGAAEEEHHNSLSIFLVLVLLGICILLIHVMLKFHFHYVPESVAVIFIGICNWCYLI